MKYVDADKSQLSNIMKMNTLLWLSSLMRNRNT